MFDVTNRSFLTTGVMYSDTRVITSSAMHYSLDTPNTRLDFILRAIATYDKRGKGNDAAGHGAPRLVRLPKEVQVLEFEHVCRARQ